MDPTLAVSRLLFLGGGLSSLMRAVVSSSESLMDSTLSVSLSAVSVSEFCCMFEGPGCGSSVSFKSER